MRVSDATLRTEPRSTTLDHAPGGRETLVQQPPHGDDAEPENRAADIPRQLLVHPIDNDSRSD